MFKRVLNVQTGEESTVVVSPEEAASFADDTPPAPARVDAWQMAQALIALDLIEQVETAVAASTDPRVKYGWAKALYFVRTDPLVVSMGAALGKTEAEMDALFALAETL